MNFDCLDCGICVLRIREYHYMVKKTVWPISTFDGKLCIRCLESRINRRLKPSDFENVSINWVQAVSPRLASRRGKGKVAAKLKCSDCRLNRNCRSKDKKQCRE